jgi:hypothetical protein
LTAYEDDIAVGSNSVEDRLQDLEAMLHKTLSHNLRLKLRKCTFGELEIEMLRHRVRHGEIRPFDPHVDSIRRKNEPHNVTELLRFLGVLNVFGNHIGNLADKSLPLYAVLKATAWNRQKRRKSDKVYVPYWGNRWRAEQRKAFENLKDETASPEFLVPPRVGARRRLVTDASQYGLGSCCCTMRLAGVGCRSDLPAGSSKEVR